MARAVTDRGANMKLAARMLVGDDEADNCLCHMIKSGVDSLLSPSHNSFCRSLFDDTSVSMALAAHVRSSSANLKTLQAHASEATAHLTLKARNETRWEGLTDNVSRVLQLKDGLMGMFDNEEVAQSFLIVCGQKNSDFPSEAFFARLQFILELLTPLRVLSKRAQAVNKPVMLSALRWISETIAVYEPLDGETRARASIRKSFADMVALILQPIIGEISTVTKAAVLSPVNSCVSDLLSAELQDQIWDDLVDDVVAFAPPVVFSTPVEQAKKLKKQRKHLKMSVTGVREDLEEAWKARRDHLAVAVDVDEVKDLAELQGFWLRAGDIESQKERNDMLVTLRCYMSMPLASSYPESTFSFTGELVSKRRLNLSVDNVEAVAIINDFMKQPGFSFDNVFPLLKTVQDEHKEKAKGRKRARLLKSKKEEQEAKALLQEKQKAREQAEMDEENLELWDGSD